MWRLLKRIMPLAAAAMTNQAEIDVLLMLVIALSQNSIDRACKVYKVAAKLPCRLLALHYGANLV